MFMEVYISSQTHGGGLLDLKFGLLFLFIVSGLNHTFYNLKKKKKVVVNF